MNFLEKLLKTVLNKNLILYNFLVTLITLMIFFVISFLGGTLVLAIGYLFITPDNVADSPLLSILLSTIIPIVIGIIDLAFCLFILIVNLKFISPEEK